MKKYFLVLFLYVTSCFSSNSHIANITGDVSLSGENTGTIVSVGGASFKLDLGIANASVDIGNAKNTVTNVNTIIIHKDSSVHNVSLKAKNTGKIINVGSKLNLNTIIIGN